VLGLESESEEEESQVSKSNDVLSNLHPSVRFYLTHRWAIQFAFVDLLYYHWCMLQGKHAAPALSELEHDAEQEHGTDQHGRREQQTDAEQQHGDEQQIDDDDLAQVWLS
jgi:hypothetical protein